MNSLELRIYSFNGTKKKMKIQKRWIRDSSKSNELQLKKYIRTKYDLRSIPVFCWMVGFRLCTLYKNSRRFFLYLFPLYVRRLFPHRKASSIQINSVERFTPFNKKFNSKPYQIEKVIFAVVLLSNRIHLTTYTISVIYIAIFPERKLLNNISKLLFAFPKKGERKSTNVYCCQDDDVCWSLKVKNKFCKHSNIRKIYFERRISTKLGRFPFGMEPIVRIGVIITVRIIRTRLV